MTDLSASAQYWDRLRSAVYTPPLRSPPLWEKEEDEDDVEACHVSVPRKKRKVGNVPLLIAVVGTTGLFLFR